MVTICLDESGNFERNDPIKFIGGVVYTGEDYEEEKERLRQFFISECKKVDVRYPNDLHINKKEMNQSQVFKLKNTIEIEIEKYLKNNKKYHLVCMIKSKKERMDYKNISNLVNDDEASNLYEHMMCNALYNTIFFNIDDRDIKNVRLEVATRVSNIEGNNTEQIEQFKKLGYSMMENTDNNVFYITDQKTFKTALSMKLMELENINAVQFDSVNIKSINYKNNDDGSMDYLYLADLICGIIRRGINENRADFNINELYDYGKKITGGNEPFIWAYDDLDSKYIEIIKKFYKNDFVGTLISLYDGKNYKSDFNEFYNKKWFGKIEKSIEQAFQKEDLNVYIAEMDRFYKKNDADYNKGIFVVSKLWNLVVSNREHIKPELVYKLADICIRAYNHVGDNVKALEFYQECENLRDKVNIEEYLDTINRVVVIKNNEFDFDSAIERENYNLGCFEILKNAKLEIAQLNDSESAKSIQLVAKAKAMSSIGQAYAFKRSEESLKYFEEAITEFGKDEKAIKDIKQTQSYILHFAMEMKDIKLYEKYADGYFENAEGKIDSIACYFNTTEGLEKRFKEIISSKVLKKDSYMLYVFIKSIHTFYLEKVSEKLIDLIRETDYSQKGFVTNKHPWELIFKNIGILLYKKNKNSFAQKFMERGVKSLEIKETTIMAINYFTEIQDFYLNEDKTKLTKKIKEFKDWLEKNPVIMKYFDLSDDRGNEEVYKKLCEKFTFMYS